MATREGLKPRTQREWRLYHLGFIEGVEKSQLDVRERADTYATRAKCNGVELAYPEWPPRPPAPPFTPQLKRRRSA